MSYFKVRMLLNFVLLVLLVRVSAQPSFTYNGFSNSGKEAVLILTGDATVSNNHLRLTSDKFFSYGRAVRSQEITFCSHNSPLSFITDLTFLIRSKENIQNADGLAFFIAPSLNSPSNDSSGRWLALMEPSDNRKPSNRLVAVEFDTYPNHPPDWPEFQDVDGNHVGVDVNGVISQNASSLTPFDARIDYDAVYVSKDLNFSRSMGSPAQYQPLCVYQ